MIKFVIVEDEKDSTKQIKEVINKIKYKIEQEVKTYEFTEFNKNLANMIDNVDERTIYVLDIELKNSKSGIEIASMIREKDWNSEIIFITNHDKMFETVYRNVYNVFDFIEKYHDMDKRLYNDFKTILKQNVDKKMFSYKGRNVDLEIYLNSILYIYRDKEDRKLIIVTDSSTFTISMGVKEILEMLDERFKMVHRACIVNTDKVSAYDWNNSKVILTDGRQVDFLSKKYRKEIESKWLKQFWD